MTIPEVELSTAPRPAANTSFQDSFSEDFWRSTYKDHKDNTVDDTFWRVARAIASVEETPTTRTTGRGCKPFSNRRLPHGYRT